MGLVQRTDLFGSVAFVDDMHAARDVPAQSFGTFTEFATEAAISRLYGGIHFRSAIEAGLRQGECIGQVVNALPWRS